MTDFWPTGMNVLVKMIEVEEKTESGIIKVTGSELKREQAGQVVGEIIAFGPAAYAGIEGIEGRNAQERAANWGVAVGDVVQFERYDGSLVHGEEIYRYVQDKNIKGVKK